MGNAAACATRLNYAREVWEETGDLPAAMRRLMQECHIGRRQAYRDLRAQPTSVHATRLTAQNSSQAPVVR